MKQTGTKQVLLPDLCLTSQTELSGRGLNGLTTVDREGENSLAFYGENETLVRIMCELGKLKKHQTMSQSSKYFLCLSMLATVEGQEA